MTESCEEWEARTGTLCKVTDLPHVHAVAGPNMPAEPRYPILVLP